VTPEEQEKHLRLRKKRARDILKEPENFKVCDQCRSISYQRAQTCSICGAYRFLLEPETIVKTAKTMGQSPFPTTSAVVPRLEDQ
jgi:hypothetical protein